MNDRFQIDGSLFFDSEPFFYFILFSPRKDIYVFVLHVTLLLPFFVLV